MYITKYIEIGDRMKKILLCIMDGVGLRKESLGNAYKNANTPVLDNLIKEYPNIKLNASGEEVGLPTGQMGNSEVGHSTIGSGRIIYQSLEKISRSIENGDFYQKEKILKAINHAKENNSNIHLIGLLSDGGIHSNIHHLFALLEVCKKENAKNVYIHVITDGRDTPPNSGIKYLHMLNKKIDEIKIGKIATLCGRYYMMDRDNNYDRVKLAYDMLTLGDGKKYPDVFSAWSDSQNDKITDEFIKPSIIDETGTIKDNDTIITFNFRPDRLRELYASLSNKDFKCFDRLILNNLYVLTMMPVSNEVICENIFLKEDVNNTLGEIISNNNLSQLRIAETEKYAHVTYFFDGGKKIELNKCKKILIPSPKVETYDLLPKMSAYEITDKLLEELINKPDLIILNYANGDMVGHTGIYEKAIIAMETIDNCIKKIISNIDLDEYTVIITADHGNCEQMINNNGTINTAHTTNLVPFIILDKNIVFKKEIGSLADIAPTILKIMNMDIPKDMTGVVLINE